MSMDQTDIIIVGAGLSGALAAWRILAINPEISVTLIDAADQIGGDQIWACNWSDLVPEVQSWAREFMTHNWNKYDVKFPKKTRRMDITYCAGGSERLRACLQPFITSGQLKVKLGAKIMDTSAQTATLESGETLRADWVLDGRGFAPKDTNYLGYQKFAGRTIKTKNPHGLDYPVIMDASVNQLGGYRFMSCLPLSGHDILIKDTYYTDDSDISDADVHARLDAYIKDKGWSDYEITHEEKGILPTKLAIDSTRFDAWAHESGHATPIGMRAGYYHAVTGNSLPQALKSAWLIADKIKTGGGTLQAAQQEMDQHEFDHYCEEKFLRLLNRTLLNGSKPEKRHKVLQGLYALPKDVIKRFYAGEYSRKDQLHILSRQPLAPMAKALKNFKEANFIAAQNAG